MSSDELRHSHRPIQDEGASSPKNQGNLTVRFRESLTGFKLTWQIQAPHTFTKMALTGKKITYEDLQVWENLHKNCELDEQVFLLDEKQRRAAHARCFSRQLRPDAKQLTDILKKTALARLLERYAPAVKASKNLFLEMYRLLPDPYCALVLTETTGRIIHLFSTSELMKRCAEKGVLSGASMSEAACGTNAVALALEHRKPAIVKGQEHFYHIFHDWHSLATPVLDRAGVVLGCVVFLSRHETGILEKLPLVTMLAKALSTAFPYRREIVTDKAPSLETPLFSPRQIRILTLVANGLTSKEIGGVLEISSRTVETHLERMRTRTGAKTTAHLITLAFHPDRISV